VFGLAEDITKKVSVRARLLATMASGVLGWALTGVALTSLDLPGIDLLLRYTAVSVAFTAFAVGGVANAVNIVDGFNGLAGGFVVIALTGVALLALGAGDLNLALACLSIAAAVVGFWLVNWPWGKLFLGDGGSYFGGFALAWACVLLIERNTAITPFAALLVCIHPVTEVLFSIYRRRMHGAHPGHPDRLHLHSLLMRRLVRPLLRRLYPDEPHTVHTLRNPATGLLLALMSVPAVACAQLAKNSPLLAAALCVGFMLGYVTLYARLVRFVWCSPIGFVFVKPTRALRRVA
jgi:UDP-N-acetylmuramyl pentapeptide phosphotransferase/UDP-N-acetylglucosamine-1-phosphate transferase